MLELQGQEGSADARQLVKIRGSDSAAIGITDQDRAIVSLQSLMFSLNVQLEAIESKINELNAKAKLAVSQRNRSAAGACLRLKHQHEEAYQRRSNTLLQLDGTYQKIIEAADQIETIKVMRASAKALRGLNTEAGDVATVEELVNDLRDEVERVEEVGSLLRTSGEDDSIADQEAIENELEALLQADRRQVDEQQHQDAKEINLQEASRFPKVPVADPASKPDDNERVGGEHQREPITSS